MGESNNRAGNFFYLLGIEKIAAKVIYKRFKINRYELNMLASLSACLLVHNKKVMSSELFFDWIGSNRQFNKRAFGYLMGLLNHGCLHRMTYNNKPEGSGNSLAISQYGIQVLDRFFDEIERLENKDKPKGHYSDLIIHSDHLPKGYTLRQAGRND
jgi:hypothetical protein